jgi:hypothetical protein
VIAEPSLWTDMARDCELVFKDESPDALLFVCRRLFDTYSKEIRFFAERSGLRVDGM